MKVTNEIAKGIISYSDNDWVREDTEIIEQERWTITYRAVVKRKSDGKFFQVEYDKSSTECQDDTPPFGYDNEDVEFIEVEKREIVVKKWMPVEAPDEIT